MAWSNASAVPGAARYAIQAKSDRGWYLARVVSAGAREVSLTGSFKAVAVTAIDRYGTASSPAVVAR